jgi:hypothetical protein
MDIDVSEEHTVAIFHVCSEDTGTCSFKILVTIFRVTSWMTAVLVYAGILVFPQLHRTVIIQLTA